MAKIQYTVRIEEELMEKSRKLSEKENRSLNNFIETALQNYVDKFYDENTTTVNELKDRVDQLANIVEELSNDKLKN